MASGDLGDRRAGGTDTPAAAAPPSPGRALPGPLDPAVRRVEAPPDLRLPPPWSARAVARGAGDGVTPEVALVARWMAAPHVERFWRQAWPAERWAAEVRAQHAGAHSRPWLVALDGEPVAYVEVYRVARDVIAAHHPVSPHDLGVHIAIGDPHRTGRGLGPRVLATVADSLLTADPRCGRVLGDPDVDHAVARRAFARAGFVPVRDVGLPHKRAALMARDRLSAGSAAAGLVAGPGATSDAPGPAPVPGGAP